MSLVKPDMEYLQILREVKPYITCIINIHYIGLIKHWLERLSEDFPDKHLRNIYLQRLCKQIEDGVLEYPFTDPPPEGDLNFFTEEENEEFFAAHGTPSAQRARSKLRKQSAQNQGMSIKLRGSQPRSPLSLPPADDDNSWVDISDSVVASDGEVDQQTKVIEQLRHENKQLMRAIGKNDNYIELNQDLTDKIIELQKQLAKAMLRNVELQKTVQEVQEQRDHSQKTTAELHKKEYELLKVQLQDSFEERERNLRQNVDDKCNDFTKKYQSLQDWYHNKLTEHEMALQEQSASYQRKTADQKTQFDEEKKQLQQKHDEDEKQLKYYEDEVSELRLRLKEERKKFQHKEEEVAKVNEAKLADLDAAHQRQMDGLSASHEAMLDQVRADLNDNWKKRFDTQAANFRKRLDDERSHNRQLGTDQCAKVQLEIRELRDEHTKAIEELHHKHKEELAHQVHKSKEQQHAAEKHSASLQKHSDKLKEENHGLALQVTGLQKQFEALQTEREKQVECYEKQLLAHRHQMHEQTSSHKRQIEEQRAAHQHELDEMRASCEKQVADRTNDLQRKLAEQASAHQLEIEQIKLAEEKRLDERSASHLKSIEEQHGEQFKFLTKLQIMFDEQRHAIDMQKDNLQIEAVMKEECFRLCADMRKLRAEKDKSKCEVERLEVVVNHLREIIVNMDKLHHKKESEMYRKALWLQKYYQKNKIRNRDKHSVFQNYLIQLEEKYKRILNEVQLHARKEKDVYAKRIFELESRLGFRLLKASK